MGGKRSVVTLVSEVTVSVSSSTIAGLCLLNLQFAEMMIFVQLMMVPYNRHKKEQKLIVNKTVLNAYFITHHLSQGCKPQILLSLSQ